MENPFKRKRCKQCGWELNFFSKKDFCSDDCASVYERIKKEYEQSLGIRKTNN